MKSRALPNGNRRLHAIAGLFTLAAIAIISLGGVSSAEGPVELDIRAFSADLSPSGDPWAVWSASDGLDTEVYYSRWTYQGWSSAGVLYENQTAWDEFPSLAFSASGTPWVAWSSSTEDQGAVLVSHWIGSRWSEPASVPVDPASHPRQPSLAAVSDGGLWLAWVGNDGNDDEIFASHWDGSVWSAPVQVGQDDGDPLAYDAQPRLVVDSDGYPWLVWVSSQGMFDDAVVASHWNGQTWTPQETVSTPDDTADVWPSLALDAEGQPWVAWQDVTGTGADARWRIYVSHRQSDDGVWSAEELASSPANLPIHEERPSLKLDTVGMPHIAWTVSGATTGIAYATWDGIDWTRPGWAAEKISAEAPILLLDATPWVLWTELGTMGSPVAEQRLAQIERFLPDSFIQADAVPQAHAIVNRYLALGDSITLGAYDSPMDSGIPVGPYPERLESKLDARVVESEVINRGISGETTNKLRDRIGEEVGTYAPQFPLIMEGTNDISHGFTASHVSTNLAIMLDIIKKYIKLDGLRPWLGTVIPRLDSLNAETEIMNQYIRSTAANKGVPFADPWEAFVGYGDWPSLMRDTLHPNSTGMQLLADTWYRKVVDTYPWLVEITDIEPPVAWIDSLPATSECGGVLVQWTGTDNLGAVVSYDVQASVNGVWTDWQLNTGATSATFTGASYQEVLGFRVRGYDQVGNVGEYSAASYISIVDYTAPHDIQVGALPVAQTMPFTVQWSGIDDCSGIAQYEVQYCVGSLASCTTWKTTAATNGVFTVSTPQYGQLYYFRARARDIAGNLRETWSTAVATRLAQFSVRGNVRTMRDEPVAFAQVVVTDALAVQTWPGGVYAAFVTDADNYDLAASRDGFGTLPPMVSLPVTGNMEGVDFYLPPTDDVVQNGDFESLPLTTHWQLGGTLPPTITVNAHTGTDAVLLGGTGKDSILSQSLTIPGTLTNATLSFLVRLDDEINGNSSLQVRLQGTTISHTVTVSSEDWVHVWFPVDGAAGAAVPLIFTVIDAPAIDLDEVHLGSAKIGGSIIRLPLVTRNHGG